MRRLALVLFCVVLMTMFALPTIAQTATPLPLMPGLGMYWLVDDNAWDGVWIRQGDSNEFDAYWSLDDEDDISASLTIRIKEDEVTVERVDTPNVWNVVSCEYTGVFVADGVTVSGTSTCRFTSGETSTNEWSAMVMYETPTITWGENASRYRAAKGSSFDFICPPEGRAARIWGTDVYTDDSAICTAAVHAGVIGLTGGMVNLEILDGQDSYESSTNNGVTSNNYRAWRASFGLNGATAITPQIDWQATAVAYRGQNEEQYTFECLPESSARPVWGTDVYTDDSSICAAAVHAGMITSAGGVVTIEILPGLNGYEGSERNGISTHNYPGWNGSYRFVG